MGVLPGMLREKSLGKNDVKFLDLSQLSVGEIGSLNSPSPSIKANELVVFYKIDRIIDDQSMIVYPMGRPSTRIIVQRSTTGLAEGRLIELSGRWLVKETKRQAGRTYYVLVEAP